MLKYFAVLVLSLCVFFPQAAFAAADDGVIGTILEVEGSATVTPEGGQPAAAAVNAPVHLNDVVKTAAASRVFILFIDNTQLTLSENTQARVDNYVFDPDNNTDNKASYSVMQGAFQYVSGLIGKKDNPDVHVDTPVGSIGIRGTNFWGGDLDGEYNVAVLDGRVALKTDAGEELVNKGQGTSVHDRHTAPVRAAALDPGRFERMKSTVKLKRRDMVRQRVRSIQGRQKILRRRYKNYMARHRFQNRRRSGNKQLNQEQRREKLRDRRQEENKSN